MNSMVRCCLELTVLFEVNVESEKQMCDMSRYPKSPFLGCDEGQTKTSKIRTKHI